MLVKSQVINCQPMKVQGEKRIKSFNCSRNSRYKVLHSVTPEVAENTKGLFKFFGQTRIWFL